LFLERVAACGVAVCRMVAVATVWLRKCETSVAFLFFYDLLDSPIDSRISDVLHRILHWHIHKI
jgi:hypothetical protein